MERNGELKEVANRIWNCWYNHRGPCEGCPNYDHQGYFTPKNIDAGPESGDPNADIVFIGLEPSDKYNSTPREDLEADEVPDRWEDRNPNRDFSNPTGSGEDEIRGWLFHESDGTKRIDPTFDDLIEGTIYYTNLKKCANTGEGDEEARNLCGEYLNAQTRAISPEVVVPFGENVVNSLQIAGVPIWDAFGDVVMTTCGDGEPYVVPSYHWSSKWFKSNIKSIGYDDEKEYWTDLAEEINRNL